MQKQSWYRDQIAEIDPGAKTTLQISIDASRPLSQEEREKLHEYARQVLVAVTDYIEHQPIYDEELGFLD